MPTKRAWPPLGDGFVVAWHDTRDGTPKIYIRTMDAEGSPLGPEQRLTDGPHRSYEPDVEVVGDDIAVAWYEETETGSLAKLGVWTQAGEVRWVQTISAGGGNGRYPVLETNGRELFCAWIEDDSRGLSVWARWVDVDGQPLVPPQRLASVGDTTWNLNAALDPKGQPWVVFDSKVETSSEELFLVRLEGENTRTVRLTSDDGIASKYPDVAFGPDRGCFDLVRRA